ncbi:MAG TPA: hypothetical protein VFF06_33525 [Polyangia bacterium]|nr:hypothetical protein [Polyangia bacterium]
MTEKIQKLGIKREDGWLYYLQGTDLFRKRKGVSGAAGELVAKGDFTREPGYLYSLDADGDIVRAKMATAATAKPAAPPSKRSPAAMAENVEKSKKLIAEYVGKKVTAKLDGGLFDHVPATFRFRFHEPKELAEELAADYTDELGEMDCLDDDDNWSSDTLVPVASVSSIDDAKEEDDDEPYEFAWVFLDWSTEHPPGVLITTTDDWGDERTVKSLAALKLTVG